MANKQKIYVVTNSTACGNYTPNVYLDKEEALKCFYDLSISDIIDAFEDDVQDILNEQIDENASDIIDEMKKLLKQHENEPEILAGEDLTDDKDDEYVKLAQEIIIKFNKAMQDAKIPITLEDTGDEAWDYITDFESFIDDYEDKSFYLDDYIKENQEEFLEFLENNLSNIEVKGKKVIIEYSDDNYNCIEFFETSIIK